MLLSGYRGATGISHEPDQRIVVDGLLGEIERTEFHRFDRRGDIPLARHHDDGRRVAAGTDAFQGLDTVGRRHAQVEDDASAAAILVVGEKHRARSIGNRAEAFAFEQRAIGRQDRHVVVDYADELRIARVG